jgi:hypothetical protein
LVFAAVEGRQNEGRTPRPPTAAPLTAAGRSAGQTRRRAALRRPAMALHEAVPSAGRFWFPLTRPYHGCPLSL